MLSVEETTELIKEAQKGDDGAKTALLQNNLPLIKSIVNFKSNVKKVQEGLLEKFGYNSTFDEDNNTLYITTLNETREGLKMLGAKQYVHSIISENEIHVQF